MKAKKPKIVVRRKIESVRERADKNYARHEKEPRRRKVTSAAARPVRSIGRIAKKEFHPIKLPDTKLGIFLSKRRSFMPRYVIDSFKELKLVTWPSFRQAITLSFAVIVFSVVIAMFVQVLDYGFGKLFKEVILK